MGRAVSSSKRLELLDLLSQGEKTVEALAEGTELTIGNASAHLKVLRAARVVETRSPCRAETTMSVGWIAGRLGMGSRAYVNQLLYWQRKSDQK